MITTPPPAVPTVNSVVDRWIESVFEEIDDPDRGWRYFRIDRDGRLRSIFGFDPSLRLPAGWVQARCGVEVPEHARIRGTTMAAEVHDVPGDTCGCGWRVYPSLTAAVVAASVYPLTENLRLDLPDIAFVGVEFAGGLTTPPTWRSGRRANDETGTVRAEWLRVTGPIYLPPGVPKRARRGLGQHYPECDVVEVGAEPFLLVEADALEDYTPEPDADLDGLGERAARFVPIDSAGWSWAGAARGSSPGGVYRDPAGGMHYVKRPRTAEHARSEVLAAALYAVAGVEHADLRLARMGGSLGTVSPMLRGARSDLAARRRDPEYVDRLREGFAVDVWLANWDVVGTALDNVVTVDGRPVRLDPGGALLYRARGTPKGQAFGDDACEWDSLRDPRRNPEAASLFAGMTDRQLVESARRVVAVPPALVDALVARAGFGDEVAATLRARRVDVADRAGLVLPEEPATSIGSAVPADGAR